MKLNELLTVVDETACLVIFKLNGVECSTYNNIHGWSDIYRHSEIYDVKSLYATNKGLVIEVQE